MAVFALSITIPWASMLRKGADVPVKPHPKPNTACTGLFSEGKLITLELPQTVDLVVTDTPPVATGATATNQLKEAFCETGLRIRVPQFIKLGETVRVSTTTGDYLSRA